MCKIIWHRLKIIYIIDSVWERTKQLLKITTYIEVDILPAKNRKNNIGNPYRKFLSNKTSCFLLLKFKWKSLEEKKIRKFKLINRIGSSRVTLASKFIICNIYYVYIGIIFILKSVILFLIGKHNSQQDLTFINNIRIIYCGVNCIFEDAPFEVFTNNIYTPCSTPFGLWIISI